MKIGTRLAALGGVALAGALTLTACGTDDNRRRRRCGRARRLPEDDGQRGRVHRAGERHERVDQGLPAGLRRRQRSTTRPRFGRGHPGVHCRARPPSRAPTRRSSPRSAARPKQRCKSGKALDLPMVGGPIAVVYNVPGVDKLVLDAADHRQDLRRQDHQVERPGDRHGQPRRQAARTPIQTFHRSDESGTTDNFTKYLTAAAPDAWPYERGKTWAGRAARAPTGSAGVARPVKQTAGAIGYFELSYATQQQAADRQDRHRRRRAGQGHRRQRLQGHRRAPRSPAPATTWR